MDGLIFNKAVVLPHVTPSMLNPEFWLDKRINPRLGAAVPHAPGSTYNAFRPFNRDIYSLLAEYHELLESKKDAIFYNESGGEIAGWPNRLSTVGRILSGDFTINYGLVVAPASLKFLPSPTPFFKEKTAPRDLDRNQISGLDPGDPVIVLEKTAEHGYFPVVSERGTGWLPSRVIAFGSKQLTASFHACRQQRMIIDSKAALLCPDGIVPVSMGCSFPSYPSREDTVLVPKRQLRGELTVEKGKIAGESVSGPLPPTAENCIRQAFKYLGCLYVWGDESEAGRGRDCSRLIQDVLATMAIKTPRDSQDQFKSGKRRIDLRSCSADERCGIIRAIAPGNLLFTDSHVMIYLGTTGPSIYIIHACYQYRDLSSGVECDRMIKQVTVSDLSLGEGTSTGSLLDRLIGIVEVF